jgi:hypothetical protein
MLDPPKQGWQMAKQADSFVPRKRDGLVVQTIGDEAIVYDGETHKAHSLNRTAALVFQHVDGKAKASEIARKVGGDLGGSPNERLIRVALDRLGAAGLLKAPMSMGRRAVVRGLTIALLPVVTSILVPKAAAAGSCLPNGSPCTNTGQCCSTSCCTVCGGC